MTSPWPSFRYDIRNSARPNISYTNSKIELTEWKYLSNGPIYTSAVITSSGSVLVSNDNFYLDMISSTGSLIWSYNYPISPQSDLDSVNSSPLLDEEGNIYVGCDVNLVSLTSDGSVRWKFDAGSVVAGSPIMYNNTIFVGGYSNNLCGIYLNGTLKWTSLVTEVSAAVAISSTGRIIAVDYGGVIYSLDSITGTIIWSYTPPAGTAYQFAWPVLDRDDSIYIGTAPTSTSGVMTALYSTGSLKWAIEFDGEIQASVAIGQNDTLYFGCWDLYFYAVDSTAGSIKWKYYTGYKTDAAAAVDSKGDIYVNTDSVLIFTPAGSLRLKFYTGNYVTHEGFVSSAPSLGFDGMVYVGTATGYIYAINSTRIGDSQQDSGSSLSMSAAIIGGVCGGVGALILASILFCYYYVTRLKHTEHHSGELDLKTLSSSHFDIPSSENPIFGGLFRGPTMHTDSARSKGSPGASSNYDSRKMRNDAIILAGSRLRKDLKLEWSRIYLASETVNEAILGNGSFGTVVRAKFSFGSGVTSLSDADVAVKVLTRSSAKLAGGLDFKDICVKAYKEVELMAHAESRMVAKDSMIHVYGVVEGILPPALTAMFHLEKGEPGIGIVMSFQAGGSLEKYIDVSCRVISTEEKIRILCLVSRSLAELHALNIVHADIKPANILLSDEVATRVVLADFGLSSILSEDTGGLGSSSLQQTKHARGTPIFCAPEMLINPFDEKFDERVAKASRKTDMYAFGILSWQVLSQSLPFAGVRTEAALCAQVHQGTRPPLHLLPTDTPVDVKSMIISCWDKDRSKRKLAVECMSILGDAYAGVTASTFTVRILSSLGGEGVKWRLFHDLNRRDIKACCRSLQEDTSTSVGEDTYTVVILTRDLVEEKTCYDTVMNLNTTVRPENMIYIVADAGLQEVVNKVKALISDAMENHVFDISGVEIESEKECIDPLYNSLIIPLIKILFPR